MKIKRFRLSIRKNNGYYFFETNKIEKFNKIVPNKMIETADEIICYEFSEGRYQELFKDTNFKVGFCG